jgi:hypothetical protein
MVHTVLIGSCHFTVLFDNDDKALDVDGYEHVIELQVVRLQGDSVEELDSLVKARDKNPAGIL